MSHSMVASVAIFSFCCFLKSVREKDCNALQLSYPAHDNSTDLQHRHVHLFTVIPFPDQCTHFCRCWTCILEPKQMVL